MNKEAILEIADLIEKSKPTNFHMGSWFGQMRSIEYVEENLPDLFDELHYDHLSDDVINVGYSSAEWGDIRNIMDPNFQDSLACNTTACIAGWTVFNHCIKNNHNVIPYSIESTAAELLDLNTHETARLFYCGHSSIWNDVAEQYEFYYDRDLPETWAFPPLMVADVLRRIANGNLSLTD